MAKYAAETDRLWLQPLSVDDHLEDFHQIMSDKKAISFSYVIPYRSLHLWWEEFQTICYTTTINHFNLGAYSESTRRSHQPPADILITKSFMLKFVPSLEKPWVENYAILLRASQNANENGEPRMIGTVGSTRLADEDAIEIAYGLHSDYWGKGYMVEALRMFIKLYWAVESKPLSTLPAPGNFYPQSSYHSCCPSRNFCLKPTFCPVTKHDSKANSLKQRDWSTKYINSKNWPRKCR